MNKNSIMKHKEDILSQIMKLPEDRIKEILDFIDFIKTKIKTEEKGSDDIKFRSWNMGGFKGVTREEIYSDI